jgi:hypothetical protein
MAPCIWTLLSSLDAKEFFNNLLIAELPSRPSHRARVAKFFKSVNPTP